jgi:hypothetical protein
MSPRSNCSEEMIHNSFKLFMILINLQSVWRNNYLREVLLKVHLKKTNKQYEHHNWVQYSINRTEWLLNNKGKSNFSKLSMVIQILD